MTRGKIVIFTDKGIKSSCEFNGDMYLPSYTGNYGEWFGHGLLVYSALKEIETEEDYTKFVEWFNDTVFKYEEDYHLFYETDKSKENYNSMFDFSVDYFKNWFSDYIYIKNITKEDITITCEEDVEEEQPKVITKVVKQGEVIVLNFGRLVDHNKIIADYFTAKCNLKEM